MKGAQIIIEQSRAEQSRAEQSRAEQSRAEQPIARNSSLELLRIVAMLMIVACHTNHAKFNFPSDTITINRLWQQFISMGGSLGNNIFVLISGYFLVKSPGLNLRRLFNLWVRIFFYSAVFFFLLTFSGFEVFSWKMMLKSLLPISKKLWWFASTYFVLYLIHPYVNILLNGFSLEEYKKFLTAIFLYWCIMPMLTNSDFQSSSLINFICLYSLAGYVRLWSDNLKGKKFLLYGAAFILINFLSVIALDIICLKFPYFLDEAVYSYYTAYFVGMMRPFTILATVCLLIGFRSLEMPYSKIINTIAGATFGVYLIHENNFVKPLLWDKFFHNASFQNSPYLIPYSIFVIITVYVVCTLIELTRSKIFKLLSHGRLS